MILKIFSVFDSKAEAFLPPFFMHNTGMAVRTFGDTVNMPDYTLFEMGAFSDDSGSFEIYKTPKSLGLGVEFVVRDDQEVKPDLKLIEGEIA